MNRHLPTRARRRGVSLLAALVLLLGVACSQPRVPESGLPWFTETVSGTGRTVVFLPDLGAPGDVWDSTVAHLQGHVEAHIVNIAGFAGVPPPAPGPVIQPLRDALARYLRDHGKHGTILVGHMFGATVAYSLALSDPDLVGGVVAVDALPTVGDGDPKDVSAEAEEGRQGLANADPAKFARMTKGRLKSMMASPEEAERVASFAARSSQRTVSSAFYEMMTLDLRPRLGEIKAPVLVIGTMGNKEGISRPEFEAAWHKQVDLIPHHELVVIPAAKHYVMFDQPAAFFEALDRFLANTPAT